MSDARRLLRSVGRVHRRRNMQMVNSDWNVMKR